jgi:AraC family transcriptional regulator of adaptative response / DNA-3-methyladenine glycosylase II
MEWKACEQAILACDTRFDGRFFIGARTTGVYCRPVCNVKSLPGAENSICFGTMYGVFKHFEQSAHNIDAV